MVTKNSLGMTIFAMLLGGCGGGEGQVSTEQVSNTETPFNSLANDITDVYFSSRNTDCGEYGDTYRSSVRDLTRVLDFDGYLEIVTEHSCTISSNNIPNHNFNDSSANFKTQVAPVERIFNVDPYPELATEETALSRQMWDGVMLNGVVIDLQSGGCYFPTDPRADEYGNTEAGCPTGVSWRLVPLEYTTKFGVDVHNGHVQPDGSYHYHGNPNAMFDGAPTGDGSPVIGFAADGFPIFGSYIVDSTTGDYRKAQSGYTLREGSRGDRSDTNPGGSFTGVYEKDWEWTGVGDLDECNGMFYKNQYGYYVTDSYPYILNCYKGFPDSSFGKQEIRTSSVSYQN